MSFKLWKTSNRPVIDFRFIQDSHRADKKKKEKCQKKTAGKHDKANKKQKSMFSKKVEGVQMDLLTCESPMYQFTFKILETMGYIENTLKKFNQRPHVLLRGAAVFTFTIFSFFFHFIYLFHFKVTKINIK